ncbi:MAG: FAD-dependent oxidoreductase [Elusimicrobia bacterium]|nr:FAD-dependent oxidoreductase [Elusimicrobiota bacterium]
MTASVHPTFTPRLLSVRDEVPGVRVFRFASPPAFAFVPGQFLMFHFADDPKTWRAYSLCSAPGCAAEYFEVAVGMVGAFSERLGRLTPDAEAGLCARGPFGRWTYDGSAEHAVLVSGGTGITPFRAMVLLKAGGGAAGRLTVCCSARTPELLLFRSEYADWQKAGAGVVARITRPDESTRRWKGPVGRWTAPDIAAIAADPAAVYYLCGPNKMVADLREGLQAAGTPPENVRTEKWGDYSDLF